ncbi:MAG: hypothetical protein AAGH15_09620, partial [Myxococcota bacterium]
MRPWSAGAASVSARGTDELVSGRAAGVRSRAGAERRRRESAMKVQAAVAHAANAPLSIETVDL